MRHFSAVVLSALAALLLAACATDVKPDTTTGLPRLEVQNKGLSPGNGGVQIEASALRSGDIVLSSANGVGSVGIQLVTLSPVSHAALYGGNGNVVEAVGQGIRRRPVADMVAEEATVVVFRHPALTPDQAHAMHAFFDKHVGQKYNYFGVMLQAPFAMERRLCEVPLVPSMVRDFCIRGVAAIQLGLGRNDQFFCSQFVLEAFRSVGLPLTDADPRLVNPGALLHMRGGDVPSIRIRQKLMYIGHLKAPPQATVATHSSN